MTISAETAVAGPYNGDGSTTAFAFSFKCFSQSDLAVYVESSAGAQTLQTLTTHYTVSLNTDQDASPGGTVTMVTAPASGEKLHIVSDLAYTRTDSFSNAGGFYPNTLNDGRDKTTLQIQQLLDKLNRALVGPIGEAISASIPNASTRANKYLGFDSNGDPSALDLVNTGTSLTLGTGWADALSNPLLSDEQYIVVDTYSELQNLEGADGEDVVLLLGDRGGHFRWNTGDRSSSVAADEMTSAQGDGGVWVAPATDRTGASGAWRREYHGAVHASWYGDIGGANPSAPLAKAAAYCVTNSLGFVSVDVDAITLDSDTDMQGVGLVGNGTVINNTDRLHQVGQIKNCVVRGYETEGDRICSLPAIGGVHRKALYQDSSTTCSIFVKRPGRGYLRFRHRYNENTAAGASDTGGSCENWRPCQVEYLTDVFVFKRATSAEVGTWGDLSTAVSAWFSGAAGGSVPQAHSSGSGAAEIAWTVDGEIGDEGYVGVYRSGASSTSVNLQVNGVTQTTFDASNGSNDVMRVKYELTAHGSNEIRLVKASGGLYPFGPNFYSLKDLPSGRSVDTIAWGDYDNDYVDNTGAHEYALFSNSEQKWFGSYHGGETADTAALLYVDSVSQTFPATAGTVYVGDNITLRQDVTLASDGADTFSINSEYIYYGDGHRVFNCSGTGNVTVEQFYTGMTPATLEFTKLSFPKFITLVDNANNVGRYNMVTQLSDFGSGIPRRISTRTTLFPMGGPAGANMISNGPRVDKTVSQMKFYYGPALNTVQTITDLSWTTEWLFH